MMKYKPALVAVSLILCNLLVVVTAQEPAKRRIPQLTSEDVLRNKGMSRTTVIEPDTTGKTATKKTGVPVTTSWFSGAAGYAQAEREQQDTGAPLAVYFYTDWCGYCKRLERNILASREVEDYFSSSVIRVRINPEEGPAEEALGKRYGITGYPSFFMIGSSGRQKKITPYKRQGSD